MNMEIRDSVGEPKEGADNRDADVKVIQGLVNIQAVSRNHVDRLLEVDGRMGRETLGAIVEFQRREGFAQTGLITPRDATLSALRRFGGSRTMRANQRLFDFLKSWEKLRLHLYDNDGAGNTTIGWGYLVHPGRAGTDPAAEAPYKNGITEAKAEQLLRYDVGKAEGDVSKRIHVPLTQNMFDALTSLMFNLGAHGFDGAKMSHLLDEGDYLGAARDFLHLNHVHTRSGRVEVSRGLTNRRRAEEQLFLSR